jgi:hypothetical protein
MASVLLTKMTRELVAYPGATFNPTLSCNRPRNVQLTLSTNRFLQLGWNPSRADQIDAVGAAFCNLQLQRE